jgi:hypothetical protein
VNANSPSDVSEGLETLNPLARRQLTDSPTTWTYEPKVIGGLDRIFSSNGEADPNIFEIIVESPLLTGLDFGS